jgi:hypothetical protein
LETTKLEGLKATMRERGIRVGTLLTMLGQHYGTSIPRGYKTFLDRARRGEEVPVLFAKDIAEVLKLTADELDAKRNGGPPIEIVPNPSTDPDMPEEEFLAIDCIGCTAFQCFNHWDWLLENQVDLTKQFGRGGRAQCAVVHGRLEAPTPSKFPTTKQRETASVKKRRRKKKK